MQDIRFVDTQFEDIRFVEYRNTWPDLQCFALGPVVEGSHKKDFPWVAWDSQQVVEIVAV